MYHYVSVFVHKITFTATSDKVLVQSSEARVYGVVALSQAMELADQTLVNDIPQMNALQTQPSSNVRRLESLS